jgi:hypothetical protein
MLFRILEIFRPVPVFSSAHAMLQHIFSENLQSSLLFFLNRQIFLVDPG